MAKKKNEHPPFKIIRDSREKKGNGWNFRASANCAGMEIRKLDTGDYSIDGLEHLIMIERKSIPDLWHSLVQDRERFMREMDRAKLIPARYIVVEGDLKDLLSGIFYSKVSPEFILASIVSLQIKYGVHVIFTSKRTDISQRYVRELLKKLYEYCKEGIITDGRPANP